MDNILLHGESVSQESAQAAFQSALQSALEEAYEYVKVGAIRILKENYSLNDELLMPETLHTVMSIKSKKICEKLRTISALKEYRYGLLETEHEKHFRCSMSQSVAKNEIQALCERLARSYYLRLQSYYYLLATERA